MTSNNDSTKPPTPTPEELARELASIAQHSQRVVSEFLARLEQGKAPLPTDDVGIAPAFMDLAAKMMANPMLLAQAQMRAWHDYMRLWHNSMARFLGETPQPVAEPSRSDSRFRSEAWTSNFLFDYIKQSYLIAAENIQRTVSDVQGLDPQTARKVRFFTRQFVDALAPTNFLFTNPDALKTTVETGGRNLIDGLHHLLEDLERGGGQLAISMTDYKAFKLGENVATAPGKVVYQNDLMQLIQYSPSTQTVWKTPLLIIPPWINKYYILDLREKNSFIRWAVAQGHTLFVISWVNPDERLAGKGFEDYMLEGPLAALDAIEQATGEAEANVIGYCLGGTLLACTLAWLGAQHRKRIKSATFFTAMIDFSEPGELGVFVDETVLGNLEKKMAERGGYLEGSEMAATFNLLRANDLIWSFVVNNYLLGKDPFPFDLLFWNSDATRMPAKMHTFYLRNMYIRNALVEPGAISLAGQPIDLDHVDVPTCFVSTMEDHIAPWQSTFLGAQRLPGPVKFILGGSGHIAGVVNPPAAKKYHYWTADGLAATANEWLAQAQRHDGSWWPEWNAWAAQFTGERVPARVPGDRRLPVIEDAPGAYAKLRLDAKEEDSGVGRATGSEAPAAEQTPPRSAPETTAPREADARAANDPAAASAIDLLTAAAAATPKPIELDRVRAAGRKGPSDRPADTPDKPRKKPPSRDTP
jgi:polyhydroxyalkanoate synthase